MPHWLDDALNRAIESGAFENLKGAGQPLNLGRENPFEDPSMRLANRMLKEAGYTLPWIADRNELLAATELIRQQLQRGWDNAQHIGKGERSDAVWQRTVDQISTSLDQLNRRIRDFNLRSPTISVQLPLLNLDREIARVRGET